MGIMAQLARPVSVVCLCLLVWGGISSKSRADVPSTQPSNRTKLIQQWFTDLNHADPNVRDDARFELMGLQRGELGILKSVIKASQPVQPAQASVLHDVVVQVFLAGETYQPSASPFIGIFDRPDFRAEESTYCIPGFVAFRVMQPGDMVVGVGNYRFAVPCSVMDLKTAFVGARPGDVVRMTVIRRGELKELHLKLDAKPENFNIEQIDNYIVERSRRAEAFWQQEFAPLVNPSVSVAADGKSQG